MSPKIDKKDCCPDPKCGAFIGHHPNCDLIDLDTAKSMLKQYYSLYLRQETHKREEIARAWDITRRFRQEVARWEGKFRIVKHENNQLRKKINPKYNERR